MTKEITNIVKQETMSSTQLAEMLGYEKKHLHEKIKKMFPEEVDGRSFRPSLDSRGYVAEYHLPEVESKMLVASCDIGYLRVITEYWVDRKNPKPKSTRELLNEVHKHLEQKMDVIEDCQVNANPLSYYLGGSAYIASKAALQLKEQGLIKDHVHDGMKLGWDLTDKGKEAEIATRATGDNSRTRTLRYLPKVMEYIDQDELLS